MSFANKISPEHPFMNREVILNFTNEMSNTLSMMAQVEASFGKPFITANFKSPNEISVYLILNTDQFKGKVQFHFDKDIAKTIIGNMVGADMQENWNDVLDGVGEISNIFYGSAKTKLNEIGFHLNSSSPHPCWTKNLPINIGQSLCMVIPFMIQDKECFVEFIFYE